MRRLVLGLLALLIVGSGACALLLPGGLVVRGPMLNSLFGKGIDAPEPEVVQQRIQAAEGFEVRLWATGVTNARFIRFSPDGALLVSQPRLGRILHVLGDLDGDGVSDGQRVFLGDLDRPHGIDFHDGHVYIGEGSAIARIAFQESGPDSIAPSGPLVRIAEGIPEGGNHWARTLRFGPDGQLYLSVGSSCNVCEEDDPRRAAMLRFAADGSGEEIFATGLRNSTGFDWRPGTGELFATDNGRDLLGDDYPPCELNRIIEGGFYGWPHANGHNEPDPDFGAGHAAEIARAIPPVHAFRAHNAPLGITFVRHPQAVAEYRDAALVALHGSWNRSELDGYKVVSLHWEADGRILERDFLSGFQEGNDVIGRPVDVAEGPEGAFYVSDDYAGVIYRVAPAEGGAVPPALPRSAAPDSLPAAAADPLARFDAETRRELASRGEVLFAEQRCGACHLTSQAAPGVAVKRLEDLARRYTVDTLQAFLQVPQSPMPPVDLPEADRLALAVHLLSEHGVPTPSP